MFVQVGNPESVTSSGKQKFYHCIVKQNKFALLFLLWKLRFYCTTNTSFFKIKIISSAIFFAVLSNARKLLYFSSKVKTKLFKHDYFMVEAIVKPKRIKLKLVQFDLRIDFARCYIGWTWMLSPIFRNWITCQTKEISYHKCVQIVKFYQKAICIARIIITVFRWN